MGDGALVRRILQGNRAVGERLVAEHYPRIYIASTYEMHWLVPLKPGGPPPQWFTIAAELADGKTVVFRQIPAPPPAFESVREMPPYCDTPMTGQEVEQIRARARDPHRLQRLREAKRSITGGSGR